VWKIAQDLRDVDPLFSQPMARQLFHKLAKGLDQQIVQSTAIEARNKNLLHAMDSLRPKKRCRVLPAPNNYFIQLADVLQVRGAMGVIPNSESDGDDEVKAESENGGNSVIKDCIIVHYSESESED
jgi:hypothetical protein